MKPFSLLANWLLSALTIFLISQYVKGFHVDTFQTALVVALVLGVFNAVVKPVLVVLTLPINILTLGLFTLVINAFLILLTDYFVKGFTVTSFTPALIAAVVLWVINILVEKAAFPVKTIG